LSASVKSFVDNPFPDILSSFEAKALAISPKVSNSSGAPFMSESNVEVSSNFFKSFLLITIHSPFLY